MQILIVRAKLTQTEDILMCTLQPEKSGLDKQWTVPPLNCKMFGRLRGSKIRDTEESESERFGNDRSKT